jgi:hypothetical protein
MIIRQLSRVTLVVLICLSTTRNFGQSLNPSLQSYTPPSPTAASIGKFGNIPVGTSTGIPTVSVPIYTYNHASTGLQLSVSLDYHGGGIRVDDLPSPAGSGWSLTCGGVISRNMRGVYDEMMGAGFLNTPSLPANESLGNSPYDISARPYNDIDANELDSQNDIFSYNFLGQSGKFVYGKDGNILLLNRGNVKVEKFVGPLHGPTSIYTLISKFIITDDRGLKYIFDDAEMTISQSMATAAAQYTSSWYLSKIQSPSGIDLVTFIYEGTDYQYLNGRNASQTTPMPGLAGLPSGMPYTVSTSSSRTQGKRLKTVSFSNGVTMTVDYSTTERIDPKQASAYQGDYLLKEITLTSSAITRGFKLVHDNSTNRPTLKKIIPYGGSSKVEDKYYEFFYDIALPDRLSSQQDHWGFYNNNTGSLIPTEVIAVGVNGNYGQFHLLNGGNRNTDPTRCKAGSLKRVNYPTGGYTEFEMEVNRAVDPRLNQQTSFIQYIYSYNGSKTAYCTSNSSTTTTFDFNGDANSQTEFTIQIPSSSNITCNSSSCKVFIEIRNASNQLIDLRSYDPPVGSFSPQYTFTNGTLVPGTYKIVTYTQGLSNYLTYIDFRWKEVRMQNPVEVPQTLGTNQLYVGGLRMKTISDYAASSTTAASIREYSYLLGDNVTSSGTLGFYPVYSNKICYLWGEGGSSGEVYEGACNSPNYISQSSSTIHPMMFSSGSPVAYKRVVERIKGSDGTYLGRTEYYYKSFDDVPVVILKPFPFTPPEYKEWRNGLLDRVEVYSNSGILKKEEYFYQSYEEPYWNDPARFESLRSITIAPVKYKQSPGWSQPRYFKANDFFPIAGRADLIEKITTEYTLNGEVVNRETKALHSEYFYVTNTEIKNSLDKTIKKQFVYPKDKVTASQDPTGVYQAMVNNNQTSAVVEEVKYISGLQSESVKASYGTPKPLLYMPTTIVSNLQGSPLVTSVQFHEYDLYGNPVIVSKQNDTQKTYVWNSDTQFIEAEITNASSSQVYINTFESFEGTSAFGDCHTGQKSRVNGFTKQLNNIPNGNYIVSYWSKSGTVWTLIRQDVVVNSSTYTINLSGQIDDIRFYPKTATVATYTYDPLAGVTSVTDINNLATHYVYDNFGRLKLIKDSDGNIIRQLDYHYKN